MLLIRDRRTGLEHRARTLASGVRSMYGRDAGCEVGHEVEPGSEVYIYTVTGRALSGGGGRPVLGEIVVHRL